MLKKLSQKDVEKLLEDPELMMGALTVLGLFFLMWKPSDSRVDVPGLYERRNSAWRGKGSFGKAPFGGQVRHRR